MMKFFVQKQRIELLERDAIAADQIAFVPLHFVFVGAWEGLHKVVPVASVTEMVAPVSVSVTVTAGEMPSFPFCSPAAFFSSSCNS